MERVIELLAALKKEYPSARTSLRHSNPFQLLVATILSAQSTDVLVNRITPALFRRFPDPAAFARADIKEVRKKISSVNFLNTKARNIKATSEILQREYGGRVPATMEELTALPGIARKTANVVLSQAFGKNVGIVVDTHVLRLSRRLGLTKEKAPVKIEQDLMKIVPPDAWGAFSFLLIAHGRTICRARQPKCGQCAIEKPCPSSTLKKASWIKRGIVS